MTTIKLSPFEFSRIVVIESLPSDEAQTGTQLLPIVKTSAADHKRIIPVDIYKCQNADEFRIILEKLCVEAKAGHIPILQIECHGDQHTGLHFSDGSDLGWPDLSDALCSLNRETKFNLVVVISACFGAYFLGMLSPLKAAPCYALVSATKAIVPYEIRNGFVAFYDDLFASLDLGLALANLEKRKTYEGAWYSKSAEFRFLEIVKNHGAFQKVDLIKEQWKNFNDHVKPMSTPPVSWQEYYKNIKEQNQKIPKKWFGTFFMTSLIFENAIRFKRVIDEAEAHFSVLRKTGDYVL